MRRTFLVTFNQPLYQAQVKTLRREIAKRRRRLRQALDSLQRHVDQVARGKKPTLQGTRNRIAAILAARQMKDLLRAKAALGKDDMNVRCPG